MSRCVILSAGPVGNPAALRELLRPDDVFYAADGGWRLADALGVKPAVIVGDFDSSSMPVGDVKAIRLPVRKNDTDTAAAAETAYKDGFREFLLLGCIGGRLDHQHAALLTLVNLAHRGCDAVMANEQNRIAVLTKSPAVITLPTGWKFSLFAFPDPVRKLSIRGADYPLENYTLIPSDPLCVSNSTGTPCTVTFDGESLLLFYAKD